MGWKQESQFRFHYTADGRNEMSWQPTSVYVPDKPKSSTEPGLPKEDGGKDVLFFVASVVITALAYQYINHFGYIRHLSSLPHAIVMGTTIVVSFLGSIVLLGTKLVQELIKLGIFVLCIAMLLHC